MSRPDLELARFRYPDDWPEITDQVRDRAGGRCECRGECADPYCTIVQSPDGRCKTQEERHFPRLAVVALDHNPSNSGSLANRPNLRAFCQACADAHRYGLLRRAAPGAGEVRPRARQTALDL